MSLARYSAIKTEVTKVKYAGMDDPQLLTAANRRDQPASVPIDEVVSALLASGEWAGLGASTDPAAVNFLKRLDKGLFFTVDMEAPEVVRDLNNLDAAALATKATLTALKDNRQSSGEAAGVSTITQRDLGRMRIESTKGLI